MSDWRFVGNEPESVIEWKNRTYYYYDSNREYFTDGIWHITDIWKTEDGKYRKQKSYVWIEKGDR